MCDEPSSLERRPGTPGQAWVLLRGLGREARHWGEFPQALGLALGGVPVLCPDLPGNGRRWQETSSTRVAGQVAALRAELGARGLPRPVNVLALSLGGMAALHWAARWPAEVGRLVLVNTSVAGLVPFWRRLRWPNYPALLSLPLRTLAARERMILELTANDRRRAEAVQPDWITWQRQCPVSACNLLAQLLAAARYRMPALAPARPVLVLASRRDRLVDSRCSAALARVGGWPLLMHESAGHDLALDDPAWLARAVAAWLKPEPPASPG